jgi:CubicO group peptidase (beta-lactamase class C family)
LIRALEAIQGWGADHAAAAATDAGETLGAEGELSRSFRIASVTKLLTAMAALVAVEEEAISLDDPAGPPGSTVRHLLAHASGLPFDGAEPIAKVGARRIYSNTGFEVLASHMTAATGIEFPRYLREAVLERLGMAATELRGSPAKDVWSNVEDLLRFSRELLAPSLVAAETLAVATSPVFAELNGVLPGIGPMRPMLWGLGFEIKGSKRPHWTAPDNSPGTFGHFGGSGTFLWVDPVAAVACVCLTDREFGDWALEAWPALGNEVLEAVNVRGARSSSGGQMPNNQEQ